MSNSVISITKKRGRPPGPNSKASDGKNQSLVRAMTLLERLSLAPSGMNLTDLSQQLGIPSATTHRLLNTFEEMGYLEHDSILGLWFIGLKTFSVGNAFLNRRDFIATSRPYMRRLVEQCGETVNLGIIDDGEAVYVGQVQSPESMRMIAKLGSRSPIHASGIGKTLLASMTEKGVSNILLRKGLARFTDRTIDNPADLRIELTHIRKLGYALDDEEHAIGLRCVAATIFDENGVALAGLSLSGPKARMTDSRITDLGAAIRQMADEVTAALGGCKPAGAS
ncbi:MAG: IclR family acetate operon transcriptional repressor [Gammaproteobacteria bacterium]|jgi:IclR family acetate operon transcriptional repressor